jgi:hypothetical protein
MPASLDLGPLQSGSGLDLGPLQSTAGTSLTISQSENFGFSDTTIEVLGLLLTFSEAISLSDAIALEYGNVTASDTFTFTDSAVLVCNLLFIFTDSVSLSDNNNQTADVVVDIEGDGLSLSDSIIVGSFTTITLAFSESLNLSDTDKLFTSSPIAFSDNLNLTDSIRLGYIYFFGGISDELMLQDSVSILLAPIRNLSETDQLILSDTITVVNASIFTPLNFIFVDDLSLTDALGYNYGSFGVFEDSLMLTDGITIVILTSFNPYLRRYLNDVVGAGNQA